MNNAALENAGYTETVNYDRKNNENKPSRNRKCNIIWHNPPYNKSASTNIGRVSLNLLDKHFQRSNKRNNVKLSYSCTRNIEHIIKNHNRRITESYIEKSIEVSCNSKEKNRYPFEGNCLVKNIVYMATAKTETITSSYVGMTGNDLKTRYYHDFNHVFKKYTLQKRNQIIKVYMETKRKGSQAHHHVEKAASI